MTNLIKKVFAKKPGSPKGGYYYVFQCLYCEKPYVAPGYEVNAGRMTKYCSNDCQMIAPRRLEAIRKAHELVDQSGEKNGNYKDGATLYQKFCKDNCELCGRSNKELMSIGNNRKRKPLLVHHCDMNRRNSAEKNLKTVCYSCHMRIHNPSYFGKYPDYQKW